MTRILKVTYAGVVLGKDQVSTSYILTGKYRLKESYGSVEFECEVLVSNNTRATFLTDEAALVAAWSTPDQALEIVLGTTARHSYDPSTNTGFLARPVAHKPGSALDTANSALYRLSVVLQLPADLAGRSGRKDASIEITAAASGRRTVVLSGTYTALTSNSASAQYAAAVGTWATSVLPVGTFELVDPRSALRYDDQNKVATFRLVYKEVLSNQAVGTLDHPSIVDPKLIVRKQRVSGDQAKDLPATSLVNLVGEFSCAVDKDQTQDLKTLWEATIQPRVLQAIRDLSGVAALALVDEQADMDPMNNYVLVRLLCQGDPGAQIYQSRIEEEEDRDLGVVLYPVLSGKPFDRDIYDGPQEWVLKIVRTTVGKPGVTDNLPAPTRSGYVEVRELRKQRKFPIGIPGYQLDMEAITMTFIFVRADGPRTPTGDFGGGRTPTYSGTGSNPNL